MANQVIHSLISALNQKFTFFNNTEDTGNEHLSAGVQTDGRVQFSLITGEKTRTVQFAENGIISELETGVGVLWTTQNTIKIKTISTTINANAQTAYTAQIPITPDNGYAAVAMIGYNVPWNHCEIYSLYVDNNNLHLSLQNTGSTAMTNINATFYIMEVKSNFV